MMYDMRDVYDAYVHAIMYEDAMFMNVCFLSRKVNP